MNLRYPEYWMKEHPGVKAWIFGTADGRRILVKKGDQAPRILTRLLGVIE